MEIDPKKIDYDKMVQMQGNIGAVNTGQRLPDIQNPNMPGQSQKYNDTVMPGTGAEANAFNEGVLLSGKKLFDITLDMFKERLGKFLTLIILAIVVLSVMDFMIGIPFQYIVKPESLLKFNIVHLYLASVLFSIVVSIPSMILGISIIETIKDQNLEVSQSIRGAFGKFKDYISTIFIGNFIYSGILLIVPIVAFLEFITSGREFSLDPGNWGMSILIIVIGFVLVFPLLYIVEVWIFVTLLGVILDGLKPLESFSYGYELIAGKAVQIFWRMVGLSFRLIIYALIIQITFAAAVGIPIGMIVAVVGQNSVVGQAVSYVMDLFGSVIDLGITAFVLVYQYNIYQNLKAIKKDLSQDLKTRHQGTIKAIAALGFLLTGLFLTVLLYYAPILDTTFRNEVMNEEFMKKNGFIDESDSNPQDNSIENIPADAQKDDQTAETEADTPRKRDSQRKKDLGEISLMVFNYKYTKGNFPISPVTSRLNEENEIVFSITAANGADLPRDPNDPEFYYGYTSANGEDFELTARLEDVSDPGCDQSIENLCIYRIRY